MRALVAVILLGLVVGVSFSADAQTRPVTKKTETHAPSSMNRNLALIGGGVLGLVLASGATDQREVPVHGTGSVGTGSVGLGLFGHRAGLSVG